MKIHESKERKLLPKKYVDIDSIALSSALTTRNLNTLRPGRKSGALRKKFPQSKEKSLSHLKPKFKVMHIDNTVPKLQLSNTKYSKGFVNLDFNMINSKDYKRTENPMLGLTKTERSKSELEPLIKRGLQGYNISVLSTSRKMVKLRSEYIPSLFLKQIPTKKSI
jgi:hypothetical protein